MAGLKGIGELHPDSQAFDLGDPDTMAPLLEAVRQHDLIVTTHSSEPVGHLYHGKGKTRPEVLWRFVQSCPDVTVVCAHWGGGLPFYALMPEVAEGLGNVYFDTAASPFLYDARVFTVVASLVGADRVLPGERLPAHARSAASSTGRGLVALGGGQERNRRRGTQRDCSATGSRERLQTERSPKPALRS